MLDRQDQITTTAAFFGALFLLCAYLDYDVLALVCFWCAIVGLVVMYAGDALKHFDQLEE